VRGEQQLCTDLVLHLGCVPVIEQSVGVEVLVDGSEQTAVLQRPTGPGHTAGGVDDDARVLHQSTPHQRRQTQRGRGDVTTRCGDQARTLQGITMQLGKSVDGLGQQGRLVMRESVPRRVHRGVLHTERGRQIDDATDLSHERRSDGHARFVGQTQEHHVQAGGGGHHRRKIGRTEDQFGIPGRHARVQVGHPGSGLGVAGGHHQFETGVAGDETHQFDPGVPGSADDAGAPRGGRGGD